MENYSDFTLDMLGEAPKEEKKVEEVQPKGLDFSSFSLDDISGVTAEGLPEKQAPAQAPAPALAPVEAAMQPVVPPAIQPEGTPGAQIGPALYAISQPKVQPTLADFDDDGDGVMGFIRDRGTDIASASLVRQMASTKAELGRVLQNKQGMTNLLEAQGEDADYVDKLKASFATFSPLTVLATVFTGNPFGTFEAGAEMEEEATGVRALANADLQEVVKEADTTGKLIAFDVISSAAATAPAVATAPLGSIFTTLTAMGATAYFDTTQEAYERTENLGKARVAGLIDGFVEAGTELIPLRTLFNMGTGKSVFKDLMKFLIQEEGSELAATALQDLNAKLMYAPEMTWEQAVENLARTALSTPFSAGLQAGAMRGVSTVSDKAQEGVDALIAKYSKPKSTQLSGEVVKAGELAEVDRQAMEKLTAEMETIMQEIAVEAADSPTIAQYEETSQLLPMSNPKFAEAVPKVTATQVYDHINSARIYPLRAGERVAPESLNPGEVLIAETAPIYKTSVAALRAEEARAKEELAVSGLNENGLHTKLRLEAARKRVITAKKSEREIASKLSRAQDLIKLWTARWAPDMKVILTTNNTPNNYGAAFGSQEQNAPALIYLGIEAANAESRRIAKKTQANHEDVVTKPGTIFSETLAHEFGHALIWHKFHSQPESVRRALENSWMNFAGVYANGNVGEAAAVLQPGSSQELVRAHPETEMKTILKQRQNRPHFAEYIPSFAEFLAHRMARIKGADPEMQKFFTSTKGQLEKYWSSLPKNMKYDKSFQLFLDRLSKERELTQARDKYAGRVARYRAGLDAMRRVATTPYTDVVSMRVHGVVPPTNGAHWGGRDGRTQRVNSSVDKWNWFVDLTAGLTHINTMNPHIPGLTNYGDMVQELWQDKMRWTSKAAEVLRDWAGSDYAKSEAERAQLNGFLFEADRKSEEVGRKLDADEMAELQQEFSMSTAMMELANKVWASFEGALTEVENAVVADLQNQLMAGNPAQIAEALREVRRDFNSLRNRNYMPHSRFGSYTVTGYAQEAMTLNDVEFKRGQVVHFGSFVSESDAIAGRKELEREYGSGVRFGIGIVSDNAKELLDLPPALAEMLETKLDLSPAQQKELLELRAMLAPGQSFRKRLIKREGIAGYSDDALRTYSDYMQKFAGHLARIKHVGHLKESITTMKESARGIRQQGGNSVKREKIIKWHEDHLAYLLNPGNELAGIRAVGFLWYLGFNIKSAVVNATQVPMVTYPYLAQEYNDVSAAAAISSAMYQVTRAQFTARGMDPDLVRLVEELIERGILDESLATELAALAEGGYLGRAPGALRKFLKLDNPENTMKVQKFFEYGALMFQAMEKMNRRITAVAAYQLARKAGHSHEDAVNKAHVAVRETQYEYAKFNRPRMMRGPVLSNVFMFWQYITNTMWFLGQNRQAAARYMVIMFLMGGLEGIPLAGNVLDLLDFGIKKLKEATGWSDPKKGAREFLWELTSKIDDNPMLSNVASSHSVMNGYSSRMFGMYDLSGSVQMGRIVPLTQALATDLTVQTEVLGGMRDLAGATANIPLSIIQAIYSSDPDTWKRVEKALPSAAAGLSAATRYAVRGEETDRRGAVVAEFNWPNDTKSWAELLGRGAAFQLTRVAEERSKRFASYDAIQYYTQRHNALTKLLDYAYSAGDDDKIGEAMDRIARYNAQVPFPEMMIQTSSLVNSLKSREMSRIMREFGLPDSKKHIRLQQEVEGRRRRSFEE
jgi:hypothetical protein